MFQTIAQIAILVLVYFVVNTARNCFTEEQRKRLEQIITDAILFAQEYYWDKEGAVRYEKALEYISKKINSVKWFTKVLFPALNIKTDPEDLKVLIHGILKRLKDEFKDSWYSNKSKEQV